MGTAERLARVRGEASEAARRVGRDPAGITLVAVSKTVEAPVIREFHDAGQSVFAENRPQLLRDKARELADLSLRWHFIGSLQTNKIKYVYPIAELVHSVDRLELLKAFTEWGQKTGRRCPCLLEVHISDEPTKHGFGLDEVLEVIRGVRANPHLDIRGLMGMAPFVSDQSVVRGAFRRLSEVFKASREFAGPSYRAEALSMGMTDDFPIAIEEGATIIRVGRALFGDASPERH